jgi:nucleotide-binding universal stress UspA family protein
MPIRTILVPVTNAESSKSSIETAFLVAKMFASHVDAFHVRVDPKDTLPLLGEGMSGTLVQEMIEFAEKETDDRSAKALKAFQKYCDGHNITLSDKPKMSKAMSASWTEEVGREDDHVAVRGRLADLIVVGRPVADSDVPSPTTLNAALFETGRAVMIAPPKAPTELGDRVVIFWRGSTEASRAIGAAMTFITRAKHVTIISAGAEQASRAGVEGLKRYLAWHGVEAQAQIVTVEGPPVGTILLEACQKADADLLVMGAYTHSRVRQLILGGVTQRVLTEATVPVLMAH